MFQNNYILLSLFKEITLSQSDKINDTILLKQKLVFNVRLKENNHIKKLLTILKTKCVFFIFV